MNSPESAVLIVAAGSSMRFGQDKLTALVHGKPLITYSLRAFAETPSIASIILVVPSSREEEFRQIVEALELPELTAMIKVVSGGGSRHQSVQRGMAALPPSIRFVAIHDGARPLITPGIIEDVFSAAYRYGAACLALPVTDTLHRADVDGYAEETIDRKSLCSMQTPQVFRVVDLINCLTVTEDEEARAFEQPLPTDEVSVLVQRGTKVYLVENSEPNMKVTYPSDLKMVSAYLEK